MSRPSARGKIEMGSVMESDDRCSDSVECLYDGIVVGSVVLKSQLMRREDSLYSCRPQIRLRSGLLLKCHRSH